MHNKHSLVSSSSFRAAETETVVSGSGVTMCYWRQGLVFCHLQTRAEQLNSVTVWLEGTDLITSHHGKHKTNTHTHKMQFFVQ